MRKRPLLNLFLFFCLCFFGLSSLVFAADNSCVTLRGKTQATASGNLKDFSFLGFENNIIQTAYRACVRPVADSKYRLEGWVLNKQLGWVSLAARQNPANPAQRENTGIVINSNFDYGVNIEKQLVNKKPQAKLTGYMWGDAVGWIKMNCEADPEFAYDLDHCGNANYGVEVDFDRPIAGLPGYYYLKGYAWSKHYGYIGFAETAISVPDVNFDFQPVVAYIDEDEPNYANGELTDQSFVVRMNNSVGENVSDLFNGSNFSFCFVFDDQRTLDGVTRFSSEVFLDAESCINHRDAGLNVFDSETGFVYDAGLKGFRLLPGAAPRSFLSTQAGNLELHSVKIYSEDAADAFFPVDNVALNFVVPYETVLLREQVGQVAPQSFEECVARQVEDLRFNYGPAEDYYFCYKLHRGLLGTSLNHELDLALSDRDFVDVTVGYLPEEGDDEEEQEEVQELNPEPLLTLDTNLESGVHTVNLILDKVNDNIPNSFLGLSLITKTAYKIGFSNDDDEALESKLVSSRLRSNIYESFSVFTKGFVQDRAFNALYGDTTAAQASNYAKFSSAFNEFISRQNMRKCRWGQFEAGADGCRPIGENFIYLRHTNEDNRNLDLQELYNRLGILATDVTVVLEGFNVFIGSDFVLAENPLGLIVKSDENNRGGRAFVDYDVNNIINLFLYLDKNLMSVESLEQVNEAVAENDFALLGVGSFAADSSYNQLVFAGQLISNNCSGCSRADADVDANADADAGRPASKADGSLVDFDDPNDVILAKQEDLNNMRYSPLVFNVQRSNGGLVHLNCNDQRHNGGLINGDFFENFSLEDMCYMPERFGFNISRSELLADFDLSATRSFMMFYKNPKNLPVFGDWN